VSDKADVSPGGLVYQAMIKDQLAAEFDRRKSQGGRGAVLLTSSARNRRFKPSTRSFCR
jgi:hypothetical protein